MRANLNTPFMRTQQLNLIILSRWEKNKAYKVYWELSLNSTATINEACVVGGIVFARVRALVAKPPFWKIPPIWVNKASPALSPHGLTASLLKLSRVRLDRENCIGKETIMCSRQCYSCLLIQYIAVSYFTAEMHSQFKSSTVNTYRTN